MTQVTALSNVEAKKRFEFLEAVSGTMDAHLRYFKQVSHCVCLMFDGMVSELSKFLFPVPCRDMSFCIRWSHI